jgi:hypothetical protein
MSLELSITAKGQVTLKRSVLDHLGVAPGDKIGVALLPDGRVELLAASAGQKLEQLRGMLHRPGQPPVSLEAMQDAIAVGRQRGGQSG